MIELTRESDALLARIDGSEAVEVRLVYARPVSGRDSEISILDAKSKEEVAWLNSIEDENLAPESREIAVEALAERYRINRIESIETSFVSHGHRHLKVETNRGHRYFNLKEPGKNVTRLGKNGDRVVIRDSMGNRYEIESVENLDAESRAKLEKVI
ncbi:MAG: DUF1854 domain-containing protein [Verrucomicrobiales bacterium]|nr:DUF1854 domain-containing protein [Verrucomicrobiales bacterium]